MVERTIVRVDGLKQLQAAFKELAADVQRKLAGQVTGAGARVIAKRARQLAPIAPEEYTIEGVKVKPGNIARNIVTKKLPKSRTQLTSEHIVAVRGKAKNGYASRVGALQEFGTVNHPPQPFMRPAFDQEKGFAVGAMKAKLADGITKAAKRAGAQGGKGGKA